MALTSRKCPYKPQVGFPGCCRPLHGFGLWALLWNPSKSTVCHFQILISHTATSTTHKNPQLRQEEGVRTSSDTTPVNFDPVLTRYVSPSYSFPLVLVPTLYASPLFPPLDYAPLVGALVPFRRFPLTLCFRCSPELRTFACCSLPWTHSGLLRSFSGLCRLRYVTTLVRVSPLCDSSPLYALPGSRP